MVNKIISELPLLILGILIMLIIVPIIRIIALKLNIVDVPKGRKQHTKPTALLGGVSVFLGANILFFLNPNSVDIHLTHQLFLASLMIVILGTIDDIIDMKAIVKLIMQILISIYISYSLGGIESIQIGSVIINFSPFWGIMFNAVWFVVLINAFNLIDGLDGLCTGSGIISIFTIMMVSCIRYDFSSLGITMILIGVLIGFLIFNFNPAKIFLGDGGSMLIGFYVSTLSVSQYKSVTFTMLLVIGLIAFLPLFDTALAFIRRKVNGDSVFKADALHFHHRLMKKGYSAKQAVLTIYIIMGFYALGSILISFVPTPVKFLIFIILILFSIIIIEKFYLLSGKYAYFTKFFKKLIKK